MRVKTVPTAPDAVDAVFDARRAVPLVPKPETDCCARLRASLELAARDEARTWLTFLRGLGLVERTERGFVRSRHEVDRAALADALLDGVYGAREVLRVLEAADEPLTAETVFDRFESNVPDWERHKHPAAWRDTWGDRVAALLDWFVLLGLADGGDGRYTAA